MAAARVRFGRDGYGRTGVDAIAEAAGVSVRTIYNHFGGKDELFAAVLLASATEVAERFAERVARTLHGTDLVDDLVALGLAFAAQRTDAPEHFAMVGQLRSEAHHFPPGTIARWQQAGPQAVQAEVARRLVELGDSGLLDVTDGRRAAAHFSAIVLAEAMVRPPGSPPTPAETERMVRAGVSAFLSGYGTQDRGAAPSSR